MSLNPIDAAILDLIEPNASVLDLGCGEGALLHALAKEKNVRGQGIEISEEAIYSCVEKGLSVFQGDIESGLAEYAKHSFDYVILNDSLTQVKEVDFVMTEALRVGKRVIVSIPNFAHIRARSQLFFGGRTPVTKELPKRWFETPNVRFLSIKDFQTFCREFKFSIAAKRTVPSHLFAKILPNLFAQTGIFVLEDQ